jgi:Protein of unknown function (DUF3574)
MLRKRSLKAASWSGVAVLTALVGACAGLKGTDQPTCVAGAPATAVQMLFGRAIGPQGEVGEDEWRSFVATAITPRFPDGLTVVDTSGRWRDASGSIVAERSKVVLIVVPDATAAMPRLEAIATAYKQRFRQESVGIIATAACASFR